MSNLQTIALLYCPCPSLEVAQQLARQLLEAKAIACSNVVPQIESVYHWQGQMMQEGEVLLLAKTTVQKEAVAMAMLEAAHPYELPAVCVMPIKTTQAYAAWVEAETSKA